MWVDFCWYKWNLSLPFVGNIWIWREYFQKADRHDREAIFPRSHKMTLSLYTEFPTKNKTLKITFQGWVLAILCLEHWIPPPCVSSLGFVICLLGCWSQPVPSLGQHLCLLLWETLCFLKFCLSLLAPDCGKHPASYLFAGSQECWSRKSQSKEGYNC